MNYRALRKDVLRRMDTFKKALDSAWTIIRETQITGTSHLFDWLDGDTLYEVTVWAVGDDGNGQGEPKEVRTTLSLPTPVTNLNFINITETQSVLRWTNGTNADSLVIYYKRSIDSTWILNETRESHFSFSILNNLTKNTSYDVRIESINAYGGVYSNIASFTTIALPTPATNLNTSNVGETSFDLSWTVGNFVDSQEIYYKVSSDENFILFDTVNNLVNNITIDGLSLLTTYQIKINSINQYGNYESATISEYIEALTPTPATNLTATNVDETSFDFDWTAGNNVDYQEIYYKEISDANYTLFAVADSVITSAIFTNLNSGRTYQIRIDSINGDKVAISDVYEVTTVVEELDVPPEVLPEYEITGAWEFTDKGAIGDAHNGNTRVYYKDSFPSSALWTYKNGGYGLRVDWEDSQNCGGDNSNTQYATAICQITVNKPIKIYINWKGIGELESANYDKMTVMVDDIEFGNAHAAGGGLGCQMGDVVSVNNYPNGLALDVGTYFIRIDATTADPNYHTGSYYEFLISNQPVTDF